MTHPVFVLGVLCTLIALSEYFSSKSWGKPLGAAMIVIILGAVFANLGVIPSASNSIALYDGIFTYVAPISIFYLLLGVNLKKIKEAGGPMLILFLLGSAATMIGVLVGIQVLKLNPDLKEFVPALAGMFTGTYTGGSINFNAVALHYKMNEQGVIYAGTVAVDNVVTALWLVVTLTLPKILGRFSKKSDKAHTKMSSTDKERNTITLKSFGILAALGVFTWWVSYQINLFFPSIPSILVLTTIGLVLAQFRIFHDLPGSQTMGLYLIYLFLVVIGAYCEISAIGSIGSMGISLLMFTITIVLIHGLFIYLPGILLFKDPQMVSIASQANIGGSTTAMALAESFGRLELVLPAILVGTLGNALGTYLGFLIAGLV